MENNHSSEIEEVGTKVKDISTIQRAYAMIPADIERKLGITIVDKASALASMIHDIMIDKRTGKPQRKLYYLALKAIAELNKMQGHYLPTQSLKVTVDATKDKLLEAKRVYDEV